MIAVKMQGVSFSYKKDIESTPVLNNVSLTIKQGEFIAIQGPSGSGKSTLLYLLGCLNRPNSGDIEILNESIIDKTRDELADLRNQKIGFIFQHFHLLPRTNVLNNILLPTQYQSRAQDKMILIKKAEDLGHLVGLSDRLSYLPNQLSGGQQQRVAIARALINNPEIILADEPTGSLDSKTSTQIIDLLRKLNRENRKTIIIITHDNEVASKCDRIIKIRDGFIESAEENTPAEFITDQRVSKQKGFQNKGVSNPKPTMYRSMTILREIGSYLPIALLNLKRNKTRTLLTMIGISVGIAAVLSMLTLGQYTKEKILSGYAEMGVNTLIFNGNPNWDLKATDVFPLSFRNFNWERDLIPLKRIFPQIKLMSPSMRSYDSSVNFGGHLIEKDVRCLGVNEEALIISNRRLIMGRNFNSDDIDLKKPVCIIGYEIGKELFTSVKPIGQVLRVTIGESSFGCYVVGVLESVTSNKEWVKPNLQVYLPFTFFQSISGDWWSSQIRETLVQVDVNADIEKTGKGIKAFFNQKYGASGRFRVDSDSILLAQMKRFLGLFTILLASIAFITLSVGGVGITNMMLVSVSERYREIGLRKAVGATDYSIRIQFLSESVLLCLIAGLVGLLLGFAGYHGAIAIAAQLVSKMKFEWTVDWIAFSLSLISIIGVGILSGLFPAIKAEKLEVIEALRTE